MSRWRGIATPARVIRVLEASSPTWAAGQRMRQYCRAQLADFLGNPGWLALLVLLEPQDLQDGLGLQDDFHICRGTIQPVSSSIATESPCRELRRRSPSHSPNLLRTPRQTSDHSGGTGQLVLSDNRIQTIPQSDVTLDRTNRRNLIEKGLRYWRKRILAGQFRQNNLQELSLPRHQRHQVCTCARGTTKLNRTHACSSAAINTWPNLSARSSI